MEINFDQISDLKEIIPEDAIKKVTVNTELQAARRLLNERTTKCEPIKPIYSKPRVRPYKLAYKFFCICPRYRPHYCCRHAGNIIIDRDLLTKEEHLCYLATPKQAYGARPFMPHFYHKRVLIPDCTARIDELAQPDVGRVKETLEGYHHILKKRQLRSLQKYLKPKSHIQYTKLSTALGFIEEERRLQRVQVRLEIRRCKRMKRRILSRQRWQIRKIICFLFEEMKDLLLNDQFLIDEKSTLCAVLLEQIRDFTDNDFFITSNLRQYQQVFANNLTVWINKFISNLNIHVSQPPKRADRPQPETFLPVTDYISLSDHVSDEGMGPMEGIPFPEEDECEYPYRGDVTEDTIKNVIN